MSERSFLTRLRRARLPRILAVYLGAAWIVLEVTDTLQDILALPEWTAPLAFILLLCGLVVIVATGWVQSQPGLDAREAAGAVPDSWEVGVSDMGRALRAGRLPHLTWARALVGGLVVFSLLFGFAGVYVLVRSDGPAPVAAAAGIEESLSPGVAVVPFTVSAPELQLWREGLVDLLATNLDGSGGIRGIDSRTVLARWSESIADDARPDLAGMLTVARNAGARWAVVGSLVGSAAGDVRLSADVYEADGGAKLGTAQADGPADDIMGLVDRLSVEVVRLLLGEGRGGSQVQNLSALTTSSLPALRAYLEGEAAYRGSEMRAAEERFRAAVDEDSLFALAWLRLGDVHGWGAFSPPGYGDAAGRAYRLRDRLPDRARILVEANRTMSDGSPAGIRALRAAVRRYPDDPELWYQLGEHYSHFSGQVADTPDSAFNAFERAIALDPSFAAYYIHAVDLATIRRDSTGAARLLEAQARVAPASSYHIASTLAFQLALGDSATRERAWREVETGDPADVDGAWIGLLAFRDAPVLSRVARTLFDRDGRMGTTVVRTAALQGRLREAAAFGAREGVGAATREGMLAALHATRLSVPPDLRDPGTPDSAATPLLLLARGVRTANEGADGLTAIRGAIADRAARVLAAGDTLEGRRWDGLDQALAGYAAWRTDDDPEEALRRIEAARPHITGYYGHRTGSWFWVANIVQMWLGELNSELGRDEEAAYWFRTLFWGHVLPGLARYRLAQSYEALGRTGEARQAYGVFVEVWKDADPELQPLVENARRRLAALTAEG